MFLLVTLVPAVLLLVFGWQLQVRLAVERLDQIAGLAVASLQQSLDAAALRLDEPASIAAAPDSAVVTLGPGIAQGRLLFYPFTVPAKEAPERTFTYGEQLELRLHNTAMAADWFADLSRYEDPSIRAGMLIRHARLLQHAGRTNEALAGLGRAEMLRGVAVRGVPADLFARWMACGILEESGRSKELAAMAAALHADLLRGRWQLNRTLFELHETDAARWAGISSSVSEKDLALASAAEWLWSQPRTPRGREAVTFQGRQVTVIWRGEGERVTALLAGPDYVREQWLSKLPGVQIEGPEGASATRVRRSAAETGLPWPVAVDSNGSDPLSARQGLWIGGLVLIFLFVAAGTYFIARAASRELAVARLQSDFVAAVSHEFRTPLTSLRQLTEVLRDQRVASEERRQTYYDAMARQTDRLHQLVESLLDFGRMEAGRSPYRLQPLELGGLVRSVVEQFSRENAARGYQVEVDVAGPAMTVAADPPALTNALWNLLENAVKYSPECRTVRVSVNRQEGRAALSVQDRGMGIPGEEHKEIFRKFVRGSGAKHLGVQGTGIGLAMVEHIVTAHGGEVKLESEPGAGSTFTILLPCHES